MFTCRKCMYDLRKHFFTYTAFAVDQYAKIGIRHLDGYIKSMIQRGRIAYDAKPVFDCLLVHFDYLSISDPIRVPAVQRWMFTHT